MKNSFKILTFIMLGLLVFSCKNATNKQDSNTISVGVIVPLSGELATYGESAKRGVEIAVEKVNKEKLLKNGKKLKLVFEDSKGETKTGVTALQQLSSVNNIKYFIGDISSTVTLGMIPVVDKNKVFLFSTCAATPKLTNISPLFVRNWPSNSAEGVSASKFLITEKDVKEASIVYVNNDWGLGLHESFKKSFVELGGTIISEEIYSYASNDFKTIIAKIKQSNPSYIYLAGNQKEMGHFTKQLRELKINIPLIANTSYLEKDCLDIAGKYAENVIVPTPAYNPTDSTYKIMVDFYNLFKNKHPNIEPALTDANSFDAIMLIVEAFNSNKISPDEVSTHIRNRKNYLGASGLTSYTNGDVEMETVFKQISNGKVIDYAEQN